MEIKILSDSGNVYQVGATINADFLIEDYKDCLNYKEDADYIGYFNRLSKEKQLKEIEVAWDMDVEIVNKS